MLCPNAYASLLCLFSRLSFFRTEVLCYMIYIYLYCRNSGIVYCLSRNECDKLRDDLRKVGIQAAAYHAGLADKKREEVQTGWVTGKFKVVRFFFI